MLSLGLSVQLAILYVYTVSDKAAMDERERPERTVPRTTPPRLKNWRGSNETQGTLGSLEWARHELDVFVRREDWNGR